MAESGAPLRAWRKLVRGLGSDRETGPRLLVADGSCSRSVGSSAIAVGLETEIRRRGLDVQVVRVGCDGRCYASVQVFWEIRDDRLARWEHVSTADIGTICDAIAGAPLPALDAEDPWLVGQRQVLLEGSARGDPEHHGEALTAGAYEAFASILSQPRERVIDLLHDAGLRGQGGAYFPVWKKWQACAEQPAPRYLVVNGEEGEPGVFKDRHLMEAWPHRVLEGALIAAYAVGAERIVVYVNGRAELAVHRLRLALDAAREWGLTGDRILGSAYSCSVELREGGGGYVLGEETALLESIEGRKPMPRARPPHVVERGLWGRPTVVNNVETLSRVVEIVRGAMPGSSRGSSAARAKLICVTGDVRRPGLVEVEMGISVRELVMGMAGGPPPGVTLGGVLLGGPSGTVLGMDALDRPLVPGDPAAPLGSGNVIAIRAERLTPSVIRRLTEFNANESCGKCTPCRDGLPSLRDLVETAPTDLDAARALSEVIAQASLCGHGKMAPLPVVSSLQAGVFPMERLDL